MKSCGAPITTSTPVDSGSMAKPTRPMSWYSGSHDTITSVVDVELRRDRDRVEVGADRAVREHDALGVSGRPARELQDGEPVGIVGRTLEVSRSDAQPSDVVERGRSTAPSADRPAAAR